MAARIAVKFVIVTLLVASTYGSTGFTSFSYGVSDPNTGDFKDQHEKREGGNVIGKYSLIDADGTKRIVEYSADAAGFKAVVHKERAGSSPGATRAFGHGDLAHGGLAPGPLGHIGGANGPAHLSQSAPGASAQLHHDDPHAAAAAAAGHLSQGTHHVLPFANAPGNSVLVHGPHGYGFGSPLTVGLPGNFPGGYARRSAPAISHYSHTVVHDVRPHGGPYAGASGEHGVYSRYGAQAPLDHGGDLGHEALAHSGLPSPQANGPLASSPLPHQELTSHPAHGVFGLPAHASPSAHLPHGIYASPAQGGWSSPLANGVLAPLFAYQGPVSFGHGPLSSPIAQGGLPSLFIHGLSPSLVHGGLSPSLAHSGLLYPLSHGGLPFPLTHGGPNPPLNQNGPTSPLGHGAPPPSGPQSPFFNGPLAHGALPHSALAQNPESHGAQPQTGLASPLGQDAH